MQGHRGTMGSLPEILEFTHGSTSSNAVINQPICWNNIPYPVGNNLQGFTRSQNTNTTYQNPANQELEILSGWRLSEPNLNNEASGSAVTSQGPEERSCEPTDIFSLGSVSANHSLLSHHSSFEGIPPNLNLNADFGSDDRQASEFPKLQRPSGSGNDHNHITPGGSSNTYIVEDNDDRPSCSLDGCRASCKRKAFEVGQSSIDVNSNYVWRSGSGNYNDGINLGITSSRQQANPMVTGNAESSRRNLRLRINTANQQESVPLTLPSMGNTVTHSSPRPSQVDHSLDISSSSSSDIVIPQSQPVPGNAQSLGWNEGSTSLSSFTSIARDVVQREELGSRGRTRIVHENPTSARRTEFRSWVRNQISRNLPVPITGNPSNVGSTSRVASGPGVNILPAPRLAPLPQSSSRNSRRLTEYVRRTLFSDLAGQTSPLLHSTDPSSSEAGVGNQGLHRSNTRSALWIDRQDDGVNEYPLQTLASASEGRGRLFVSEIRNVLDLMRRGESLPLEDAMLLEQSVFFRDGDHHDRHRDMRLDVDHMSYEELLALEERIGNVSTGLSEENVIHQLKQHKYSISLGAQGDVEPCCICQEEYNCGEDIGTLDCGHEFHAECIRQWLMHKNLCPVCKLTGLEK